MNVLLDTHAFLWWVIDDSQLSITAKAMIAEPTNTIYLSVVSAWEIIIKERTGKLSLPESPETYIPSRLTTNRLVIDHFSLINSGILHAAHKLIFTSKEVA
jgi:PIN domain nuclease of toxin-antitoxin system